MSLDVLVRQLQGALEGRTFRCGAASIVWPGGSAFSTALNVPSGLGGTPAFVFAFGTSAAVLFSSPAKYSDGSFDVRGATIDGSLVAAAATTPFYWLAIG